MGIHSFNKGLLTTYCMPSPVLGKNDNRIFLVNCGEDFKEDKETQVLRTVPGVMGVCIIIR